MQGACAGGQPCVHSVPPATQPPLSSSAILRSRVTGGLRGHVIKHDVSFTAKNKASPFYSRPCCQALPRPPLWSGSRVYSPQGAHHRLMSYVHFMFPGTGDSDASWHVDFICIHVFVSEPSAMRSAASPLQRDRNPRDRTQRSQAANRNGAKCGSRPRR